MKIHYFKCDDYIVRLDEIRSVELVRSLNREFPTDYGEIIFVDGTKTQTTIKFAEALIDTFTDVST